MASRKPNHQLQAKEKSQPAAFKEAARALDCDESEINFVRQLKVIAKKKPQAKRK